MNSPVTPEEESRIAELFQTLNSPLADDGFTDNVVRRIRRRLWLRRIVLSAAILLGIILALGPLAELAVLLSEGLLVVATNWNDPTWLMQNQALLIVAVLCLAWPGILRLLEQ